MQIRKRISVCAWVTGIVLIAGCAAPQPVRQQVYTPPPQPQARTTPLEMGQPAVVRPLPQESGPPVGRPQAVAPAPSPVVLALLDDVEQLQRSGDFAQAAARVERGLRIAPKDARLWQRLAVIRLQQQRPLQAETMAKKSNSLARGDAAMQAINWRIIADARLMKGDAAGAEQARIRAAQLQ